MNIIKKHLSNGQYVTTDHKKTQIFLHHTAGTTASGAWSWWNQTPVRVGTPYIIDRNGDILECYDPKYWASHLGLKGNACEYSSVPIEIVAAGPLVKEKDGYYFYPLFPNKLKGVKISDTEVVDMGSSGWRGNRYYHTYTTEQLKALSELIPKIVKDFPTIKVQRDCSNFWEYNPKVIQDAPCGIYSHSTVRKDKSDIVPYKAFTDQVYQIMKKLK